MSNEALGLPYNSTIGLSSLEPGLLPDDIIRWDGTQWQITQNDHVASPILLPGVPPTFNPEGTPPDVNAGYLYKKNGLPGLYWYPDGGPEINLLGGGGIPVIGASTNQAIVRWDGVTGDALLDSGVTLTNSNEFFQGLKRIMAFGAATENTAVGADAIRNALGNHNTAVGYESGFSHTTATDNTFVGHYAGRNVTTQGSATGVGASALENNNGAENVAVGYHAMRANTIGSSSVGVGYNALSSNTTGSNNTALGNRALQSLITSDMNTAVGSNTLTNNTAADNTAIGGNSLATNTTGTHNAALGDRSLELNTIGNENTAVGSYSLANNSTGSNNTAVGYRALVNNTTDNNTAVGFQAMESNITGTGNTAIGAQSLMGNSGDQNTALGYNAGFSNTTGDNNIFVGWNAGHSNTTGDSNVLLGTNADVDVAARSGAVVIGDSAVSAPFDNSLTINKIRGPAATANGLYYNTATGEVTYAAAGGGGSTFADSAFRVQDNGDPTKELAFEVSAVTTATTRTVTVPDHNGILPVQPVAAALMTGNTSYPVSGANNVAYGLNAGDAITTGTDNVAIGVNAASAVTTGSRNVAIGTDALLLSTADNNVAIGPLALDENTTGSNNIAVGLAALSSNITGTQNVAIGVSTLFTNTGNANTGVGNGVMTSLTSGNANTCIGASSGGDITTGNNNISVGTSSNVGVGNGAFNDTINLGHTSVPATGSFVVRPSSVRNQTGPNLLYFDNATGEVSRNAVGTLDHGGLAGLADNDHPQYLLRDGTNSMSGALNMNTNAITNATTVTASGAGTFGSVIVDDMTLNANSLSSTTVNTDISIVPNGSGRLLLNADPTAALHAATKQYVDSIASGLTIKEPVRVKTAAALPAYVAAGSGVGKTLTASANGALTIDGIAVAASDRVLVDDTGTATGADRGIYVVTDAGSAGTPYILTRATDADQNAEVVAGMFMFVTEGTAFEDTGHVLITDDPIVIDTTVLNFVQFTGVSSDVAANVGAATGEIFRDKISNTFNFKTISTGNNRLTITNNANTVDITVAEANIDHGSLAGLGDNDHPQYLLRDGTNAMTGDLNMGSRSITSIATGTVGAPSMSFTGDPNTGIYSPSAGVLGLTSNGVEAARLNANQISLATRGTVTAPAYSFTGDSNTGVYSPSEDVISFATGGNTRFAFSTAALNITSPIRSYAGTINSPVYSFTADTGTGIYSPATGVIGLTSLGFETSRLDANQLSLTTRGSAATPAYSFTPDTNTGIYSAAADTLNISTGGTNRLGINSTAVTSTLPIAAPVGTYASPGFQFGASSGIYRYDANTIEIANGLAGDGGSAYLARFSPLGGWSQIRTSNAGLTKPNVFIDQQYYGGNLTAGYGMLSLGDAYTSTGTAWNHILCWNNGGNSFRVQGNGAVYADNAYSSSGADYAEYFESLDGKSIPIGSTVVLVDGKLRQATGADSADDVIGVIRPKNSPDVAAISNVFEDYWSGKYEKDEFGEPVEESYTAYNWSEDGQIVSYHADRIPAGVVVPETKNTVMSTRLKWSPTYDPTSVYVPRSQRTEWHIVGLLGQIPIKNGEIINPRWVLMGNIGDGTVAKKYLVR